MVDGPMIRDTPYEFIRDGAESMFFRGMRERWFAGDDGRELPEMNGWRETVIKQDHWAFTDRRGPGQGFTEIRYYEILVWIMVRHGNYPPETTECLRAALLQNYKAKVFCGGRGPEQFCPRSRQWYENVCTGNFEKFDGRDNVRIQRPADVPGSYQDVVGFHFFSGGMTLRPYAE